MVERNQLERNLLKPQDDLIAGLEPERFSQPEWNDNPTALV
jgi:hypothetical protein